MIRFVIVFSILSAPLSAQTALQDRPGRWITNPRLAEPSATPAPVLEAPASGPLITAGPPSGPMLSPASETEQVVVLTAPETSNLLTPPVEVSTAVRPAAPDTRPMPRPVRVVTGAAVDDVLEVAALPLDPVVAAAVEAAFTEIPPDASTVAVAADPSPAPIAENVPLQIAALPEHSPAPRPEADATAAMAEALAAELQVSARAITTATPRAVPQTDDIAPEDALAPVQITVVPVGPDPQAPVPVPTPVLPDATAPDVLSPVVTAPVVVARDLPTAAPVPAMPENIDLVAPEAVPVLSAASFDAAQPSLATPSPAVYISTSPTNSPSVVQPVAFLMPPLEDAPILPRLHPSGPWAMETIAGLTSPQVLQLSVALLPAAVTRPDAVARLGRSAMPSHDPFPLSALPPSALAQGPDAMERAIQPPFPFAEGNAAVLFGAAPVVPVRLPAMAPAALPERDAPVTDPDAPVVLPAPDAGAVARMIDDAMICWRLADLPAEAQWAQLSVDVALDETNMPSAASIRLTGFAHVVSGAAEQAYRAALAALMGCAEATAHAAATAPTTLIFDRSGVRIR